MLNRFEFIFKEINSWILHKRSCLHKRLNFEVTDNCSNFSFFVWTVNTFFSDGGTVILAPLSTWSRRQNKNYYFVCLLEVHNETRRALSWETIFFSFSFEFIQMKMFFFFIILWVWEYFGNLFVVRQ